RESLVVYSFFYASVKIAVCCLFFPSWQAVAYQFPFVTPAQRSVSIPFFLSVSWWGRVQVFCSVQSVRFYAGQEVTLS
ncbi:hypothetical protein, partial [Endozoicomonas ascidiicola]|uniref:hypothetical protein n=1 Tax=Endozoicomonas ascidiicola TaxID=1698521 RepID=UPI001C12C7EC